jgi:hypothetical protein
MRHIRELQAEMMRYIEDNPGCTKAMIVAGVPMTIHQVNNSFMLLRSGIKSVMIGKGGGRTGTYYAVEAQMKPTLLGARIVNAGDIMRNKYGVLSPDLRKMAHTGISSYMEGVCYG